MDLGRQVSCAAAVLTSPQRVLLHLAGIKDDPDNIYEVDLRRTLSSMGLELGISRTHIGRIIPALRKKGLVDVRNGRPRDGVRICSYVVLTAEGEREAHRIDEMLAGTEVTLMGPDGNLWGRVPFRELSSALDEVGVGGSRSPAALAAYVDPEGVMKAADLLGLAKGGPVKLVRSSPEVLKFYGRDDELHRLGEMLRGGPGNTVVVTGMPGVGKSTLAARFVETMAGDHHRLWVRVRKGTAMSGIMGDLVDLVTAMGVGGIDLPPQGVKPDTTLFTRRVLDAIGSERVLVVIDDFQHAGADLVDFVRQVREGGDRAAGLRLLLLQRHPPRLPETLPTLPWEDLPTLDLQGLDEQSAVEYLVSEKHLSTEDATVGYQRTGGVPFFLEVLDRPAEFEKKLDDRVFSGLEPGQRSILEVLSTYRMSVPPDMAFMDRTCLPHHLEVLRTMNLVRSTDDGRLLCHDLLREHFYRLMGPVRRMEVHRHCAGAIADHGEIIAPVERLYHLLAAGEQETAAREAVENFEQIHHSGQLDSFNELLNRFEPREVEGDTWTELCLTAGKSLELTGDFPNAISFLEQSYDTARERSDRSNMARALCRLSKIVEEVGDRERVGPILDEALRIAEGLGDTRLLIEAKRAMGNFMWKESRHGQAREFLESALELLRQEPAPVIEANTYIDLGGVHYDHNDLETSLMYMERALDLMEDVGDPDGLSRVHGNLMVVHSEMGNYEMAVEHGRKRLEITETVPNWLNWIYGSVNLAHTYALAGMPEGATSLLDSVWEDVIRKDMKNIQPKMFRAKGLLCEIEGDHDGADEWFGKAMDIAEERFPRFTHKTATEYARVLVERGENRRAGDVIRRSLDLIGGEVPDVRAKLEAILSSIQGCQGAMQQ